MKIKIKHRQTGNVLFSVEAGSLRLAVEAAVKSGADLSRADLSRADLSRADLSRADLSRANLSRADLSRADLSGADLSRANLSRADLSRADLSRADLSRANLYGADLSRAKIYECHWSYQPPLIVGSKHLVRASGYDLISVGCQSGTLEWWREQGETVGSEDGFSAELFAEYRLHIEHIAAVMEMYRANGWVKRIESEEVVAAPIPSQEVR